MSPPAAAQAPPTIRLLCAEDSPDDFELTRLALEQADPRRRYLLRRVEDAAAFVDALEADRADAVLCDFNMPRFSPYAALQLLAARGDAIPLVVVTRAIGEEATVDVLRSGARDYVTKDKLSTLAQVIDRVLKERQTALDKERLGRELELAYRRLKQLSARLVVAEERERSLISRELHDQLGQALTGVVIHLHAAQRSASTPAAPQHLETAIDLASSAIQLIKGLSFRLRPAELDLLGLSAAVQSTVQCWAEPAGLRFRVVTRGREPPRLGDNAAMVVRLVQESLAHIVRRPRASFVCVRLRFLPDDRIGVFVIEDGVDTDGLQMLDGQPSEHGLGLRGMMERVELAGSRLHLRARPGKGVAIRAIL